jgi:hypothetical protein
VLRHLGGLMGVVSGLLKSVIGGWWTGQRDVGKVWVGATGALFDGAPGLYVRFGPSAASPRSNYESRYRQDVWTSKIKESCHKPGGCELVQSNKSCRLEQLRFRCRGSEKSRTRLPSQAMYQPQNIPRHSQRSQPHSPSQEA